jgi:diguanylate cyclase (GGDEF)-like protein
VCSSDLIRFENERLAWQLGESNRLLSHLADNDALTGIPNRRALDRHLENEWNRHCRTARPLALLFIDIDYFKQYNDTYGHDGGDRCLVRVAELLCRQVQRTGELVARFGGEEFAVVLPNTDCEHAVIVAESIRKELEHQRIPHAGSGISDFLTLSVGVSSIVPDLNHSIDALRQIADLALYEAKNTGRNKVICCNSAKLNRDEQLAYAGELAFATAVPGSTPQG